MAASKAADAASKAYQNAVEAKGKASMAQSQNAKAKKLAEEQLAQQEQLLEQAKKTVANSTPEKIAPKASSQGSYYKVINGVKYDREILEKAQMHVGSGGVVSL